ncbi:hypothetical protein ASPTUDRAFT_58834 [Aspergillus tubingensis CBS 134.48]|uniref:[acyl-carrier-protein] S-malonyltransferase n=1 Tax=Aspergillus tubingensis (strain CBS 134.48) TaxID=767770 RepID=A0A1L9MX34_ASPTC|nr:hypothetical protein ASPTUDRAFT_58834 [Aspergillus tubingensis CBS 134.48]
MLASSPKSRLSFRIKAPRYHAHCRTQLKLSFQRDYASPITAETALRTALFFPGHGVQRVGMASSWVERFPKISSIFLDEMDSILGFKLSHIISEGPNSELDKTENCQPAIMATSILILRILEEEFGFMTTSRVDATLGHSLGEFSALVAGGYLDFSDALKLVRRRAEIMSECTRAAIKRSGDEYGMIALVCEPDHMSELLSTIYEFIGLGPSSLKDDSSQWYKAFQQVMVANINSRNQIVLSGNIAKIRALLIQLRQFGGHDPRAVRLRCESPFHSPIMIPAANYMKCALEHMNINFPARMPCISNVSGLPFNSKEELRFLLSQQCVDTVKWWDSIRYLDQTHAVTRWIGIGPGKVGRNLVGKEVGKVMVKGGGVWSISDPSEIANVLSALDKTESDPPHDRNG